MKKLFVFLVSLLLVAGSLATVNAGTNVVKPMDSQSCFSDYAQYFEDGIHKGRSWLSYMCYDPGHSESWENVPGWFNDKASAVCVHSDAGHSPYWLSANIYLDWQRGRYIRSFQVASGAEQCWNFFWYNDAVSSVGFVWVLR